MNTHIIIKGAKTHNLKDISLELPKNKMIIFTGLSGSGKSSLAFDTIYAEGQRRYVESLSSYARQFLGMMEKPEVDSIEGLSPAISIDQKTTSHNPRSTVGTVTEIYDYLRVLFARIGSPFCPNDGSSIKAKSVDQIVEEILALKKGAKVQILSPVVRDRKGNHTKLIDSLRRKGFVRVVIDGEIFSLEEDTIKIDKNKKHTIDVVVDRIVLKDISKEVSSRVADGVELAVKESEGLVKILEDDTVHFFSTLYSCTLCGFSLPELHPRIFSFNLPEGACENCHGLGSVLQPNIDLLFDPEKSLLEGALAFDTDRHNWFKDIYKALANTYKFSLETPYGKLPQKIKDILIYGTGEESIHTVIESKNKKSSFEFNKPFEGFMAVLMKRYKTTESQLAKVRYERFMQQDACEVCLGRRLKPYLQHIVIEGKSIGDVTSLSVKNCYEWLMGLTLNENERVIAEKLLKEIESRLSFLVDVGLDYLTIHRRADSLSGGEMQRIRLATQIGTKLTGVLYVLDEPSIGLHQKDNDRLIKTLLKLRDLGNTLIVVEHDDQIIKMADFVVDIGPRAGVYGGEIVASGSLEDVLKVSDSLTAQYLSHKKAIEIPKQRRKGSGKNLVLEGAKTNNLKDVTVKIPLGQFVLVTGVSGSGKSSLIRETLLPAIEKSLGKVSHSSSRTRYKSLKGAELIDSMISINQKPIGRTPRSNPATYVGVFNFIRDIFAGTNDAKAKGYTTGRFSFNVKGGRCESCTGDGLKKIEMHFLADVYVTCEVCKGKRYNAETLEVLYKGKNIFEVLEMSILEAHEFFINHPSIKRILGSLLDVGLEYLKLGQSSTTLSGGEAQRIKLSKELAKRSSGQTLYILDEPTTGLHFADVHRLSDVLNRLVDLGNTVIVIEHNLDLIKMADTVIDVGPSGGDNGGTIVATGSPEDISKNKNSFTGKYLKNFL